MIKAQSLIYFFFNLSIRKNNIFKSVAYLLPPEHCEAREIHAQISLNILEQGQCENPPGNYFFEKVFVCEHSLHRASALSHSGLLRPPSLRGASTHRTENVP